MIVVGYQGVGKSTLAGKKHKFIDLESGNFWVDGKRADDWYKPYCNIAEHLSQQGYIVFTSSHEVVRKELYKTKEEVVLLFPSLELKDNWIERLEKRYISTKSEKDYKALMNAKDRYEENIKELMDEDPRFTKMILNEMKYDLEKRLINYDDFINNRLLLGKKGEIR